MRRSTWLSIAIVAALVAAAAGLYAATRPGQKTAGTATPSGGPTTGSTATSSPATSPATQPPLPSAAGARFDHIFVVLEENMSYGQVVGNSSAPYINGLIKRYALATNYSALFHPSLPNYIALTSGSNQGITDDRSPPTAGYAVDATNLADRLEAAGLTWRAYAESIPSPGFASSDTTLFATRHVPYLYYKDILDNAGRRTSHVVPFTRLATDLKSTGTTPDYAFITPNLCNDMHDCPIGTGDAWLARTVPLILQSRAFATTRSLLVITWDEGSLFDNRVATILVGNDVKSGYRSSRAYDHYSLLHTIEANWSLAPLTSNDARASLMTEFFK
jgi:hypothetical protein